MGKTELRKPRPLPQSFGEEIRRDAFYFLGGAVLLVGWHVLIRDQVLLGLALMAAGLMLMI